MGDGSSCNHQALQRTIWEPLFSCVCESFPLTLDWSQSEKLAQVLRAPPRDGGSHYQQVPRWRRWRRSWWTCRFFSFLLFKVFSHTLHEGGLNPRPSCTSEKKKKAWRGNSIHAWQRQPRQPSPSNARPLAPRRNLEVSAVVTPCAFPGGQSDFFFSPPPPPPSSLLKLPRSRSLALYVSLPLHSNWLGLVFWEWIFF